MSFTGATTRNGKSSDEMPDWEVTAAWSGEFIGPAALVRVVFHHHVSEREHDRREAVFSLRLALV
jgi:hypothetical protein